MIDIVIISKPIFQMDIIINGSYDIFLRNMLRYQIVDIPPDRILKLVDIAAGLFQKPCEHRIIHLLRHSDFFRINIHNSRNINHHIRDDLDIALLVVTSDPHVRNRRILYLIGKLPGHLRALFCDHFACDRASHALGKDLPGDTVL